MNAAATVAGLNVVVAVLCLGGAFLAPFTPGSVALIGIGLANAGLAAMNAVIGLRRPHELE